MTGGLFVLLGYLLGSLSFAVIVAKLMGLPDPRTFGSKNPGATNVLRTGRKAAAALTLLGDSLKGTAAVLLARWFTGDDALVVAGVAVAAFLGHLYPVFFGFKGGKGVATALGILLALSPWVGLACLATWVLAFYMWRTSSLAALLAAGFAPLYAGAVFSWHINLAVVLVLSGLLFWRHRQNIRNMLDGKEGRFGGDSRPIDQPPE